MYTPNTSFVGTDSFTVQAFDGILVSNVATVTIDVQDTAPGASDAEFWTHAGQTLTVGDSGLTFNVWDNDDNPSRLTFVYVTGPGFGSDHGTGQLNLDGTFTYQPDPGFVGDDFFSYRSYDGLMPSAVARVTIHVLDNAPVANDSQYYVWTTGSLSTADTNVLSQANDADEDSLSAVLLSGPHYAQLGSFSFNTNGTFSYTPMADPPAGVTQDTFTWQATDGFLTSDPATVTINWTDVPVGRHDTFILSEDGTLEVDAAHGVLANDFDYGNAALQAQLMQAIDPLVGALTLAANGALSFQAGPNFNATIDFTYAPLLVGIPNLGVPNLIGVPVDVTILGLNALQTYRSSVGLRSVNFITPNGTIMRDPIPGQPVGPYGTYQWRNINHDGVINGPDDHQYPVTYAARDTVRVSAVFWVDPTNVGLWQGNSVLVRATASTGAQLGFAQPVRATLQDNFLSIETTSFNTPLANHVDGLEFQINWELSPDGGRSWFTPAVASSSRNAKYVTLNRPTLSAVFRYEWIFARSSMNQPATGPSVISSVQLSFSSLSVNRIGDGGNILPLRYYTATNWFATSNIDAGGLLATGAGQCIAWSDLFISMLMVQGVPNISTANRQYIYPKYGQNGIPTANPEAMVVKNWNFADPNVPMNNRRITLQARQRGSANPANPPVAAPPTQTAEFTFNWSIVPVAGDNLRFDSNLGFLIASSNAGTYSWQNQGPVTKGQGLRGQNNLNPPSIFSSHVIVKLGENDYYDPSYAASYTSPQDFERRALAGFVFETTINNQRVFAFRQVDQNNPNDLLFF